MARQKSVLAVTVGGGSLDRPAMQIRLNRFTFALCLILLVGLVGLSSMTIYTLLDGQAVRPRPGDSTIRSSTIREQEQEKLIKLGEERLLELQKENAARKKDMDDLEGKVVELSNSIKTLQQLAKDIEQRLPGGVPAPAPTTGTGLGKPNSGGTGGAGGGALDIRQSSTYTTQFNRVMADLGTINKSISNNRLSISTLDVQVQSYKATLTQQKNLLDTDQGKLLALAKADGANPPRTLPVDCAISSPFGMRWSPFVAGVRQMHYGVDIACYEGTPVPATKAGIVTYVGYDSGYGNRVEITHAGGWLTLYGHNNRILVKVGQAVQKGDIIALSGNTGASTGPHIHYELHQNGIAIDPVPLLAVPPTKYTN